MKYITKPETALHTKLTVATAVRDAMQNLSADYMSNVNITKTFLIKTYNKLNTQREIEVSEAISHLLNISDHYTEAIFERLHTSHLLQYIKRFGLDEQSEPSCEHDQDEILDSQLIVSNKNYVAFSYFDDYACRGPYLNDLCLYDYCSLIYKSRGKGGIDFASEHSQYKSHRQFIRQDTCAISNLLERLLFVNKTSKDVEKQEQYYCLVSWIFISWSHEHPHQKVAISWKEFYNANKEKLVRPRLLHHIDNLDLLHKSKEESQFDLLQQKARFDEDALNAWTDNEVSEDHIHEEYDSDNENEDDAQADANAVIEEIVSCSMTSTD